MKIAIIGGSGLERLLIDKIIEKYETPFGQINATIGKIDDTEILFIPRHGPNHEYPPHKVKYKANIYVCKKFGAEWVIATSAVGSLRENLPPGTLVIPTDLIDFTKNRDYTFFDDHTVHIDFTHPYCEKLSKIIFEEAKAMNLKVIYGGTYVCFEGPRFETPSEIKMFKLLGADIVGMTNAPEAALARELAMHYSLISLVTNYAAGMQKKVTHEEVYEIMKKFRDIINSLVHRVVNKLQLIGKYYDYCLDNEDAANKFLSRWE